MGIQYDITLYGSGLGEALARDAEEAACALIALAAETVGDDRTIQEIAEYIGKNEEVVKFLTDLAAKIEEVSE